LHRRSRDLTRMTMRKSDNLKNISRFESEEIGENSVDIESEKRKEAEADLQAEPSVKEDAIKRERDEYYDLLLRKQAEFENYKRRVNKEKSELRKAVKIELLRDLLPVLDACEKGLDSMKKEGSGTVDEAFIAGYELLLRELKAILEKNEVTQVPGVGESFDPSVHEAVVREMTRDFEEGEILEEFRKGYQVEDRLLRPSQVKVAVWPEEVPAESRETS